ncbi:hypothetical protein IK1_04099 [Bacillus cereus VD146]|uniref:Fur-regulated basic protein FbpA n=1 Tax=Bacillus cereus (strain VD146) TaxID=1053236 RepID=R8NJ81_BACCX|nr:hypothetical protein IC3_05109 [Bacillus cereus VD142]EOP46364.1 hypothetical protein IK1_04099 [Bacillus cereus VD146]
MRRKDELIVYLINNGIYKVKRHLWGFSEKQLENLIIKKLNTLDKI